MLTNAGQGAVHRKQAECPRNTRSVPSLSIRTLDSHKPHQPPDWRFGGPNWGITQGGLIKGLTRDSPPPIALLGVHEKKSQGRGVKGNAELALLLTLQMLKTFSGPNPENPSCSKQKPSSQKGRGTNIHKRCLGFKKPLGPSAHLFPDFPPMFQAGSLGLGFVSPDSLGLGRAPATRGGRPRKPAPGPHVRVDGLSSHRASPFLTVHPRSQST